MAMEKHLRGLDVAMVELSYRYDELYWAGTDGNWEYAGYQAGKMRLALDNALERRPKRQASTAEIFFPALERVESAIAARDRKKFPAAFEAMTASCNACHAAEGVPTFRVAPPDDRTSSTTRRP